MAILSSSVMTYPFAFVLKYLFRMLRSWRIQAVRTVTLQSRCLFIEISMIQYFDDVLKALPLLLWKPLLRDTVCSDDDVSDVIFVTTCSIWLSTIHSGPLLEKWYIPLFIHTTLIFCRPNSGECCLATEMQARNKTYSLQWLWWHFIEVLMTCYSWSDIPVHWYLIKSFILLMHYIHYDIHSFHWNLLFCMIPLTYSLLMMTLSDVSILSVLLQWPSGIIHWLSCSYVLTVQYELCNLWLIEVTCNLSEWLSDDWLKPVSQYSFRLRLTVTVLSQWCYSLPILLLMWPLFDCRLWYKAYLTSAVINLRPDYSVWWLRVLRGNYSLQSVTSLPVSWRRGIQC